MENSPRTDYGKPSRSAAQLTLHFKKRIKIFSFLVFFSFLAYKRESKFTTSIKMLSSPALVASLPEVDFPDLLGTAEMHISNSNEKVELKNSG